MLNRLNNAITAKRLGQVSVLVLGFELFVLFILLSKLVLSPDSHLFGYDFIAFWSAAKLAVEGHALDSFRPEVIAAIQGTVLSVPGFAPWLYPPTMHLVIAPLGLVGFSNALLIYTLLGMCAIAVCTMRVIPEATFFEKIPIIAAPVVFLNFIEGQNGAITTLIMVMFLLSLQSDKPKQAGFWAALFVVKPQLGLLIPVVLIARGKKDVLVWGFIFAVLFCGVATLVFGVEYWSRFLASVGQMSDSMQSGEVTHQHISAFMFAQMIGIPNALSMSLQLITALFCISVCWIVWRDPRSEWPVLMATVLASSPMVSPYSIFYDAEMSAVAVFILLVLGDRRGFLPAERIILVLVWFAPVSLAYLTRDYGVSILYPAYLMLIISCYRRYRVEVAELN